MVTTASKFFFAGAVVALVAALAYGIGTDGDLVGVLTLGLRGPVGEIAGYAVLLGAFVVLVGLGTASAVLRDADPDVQAAAARLESLPPVVAPTRLSYWPVLGALAAVVAAVGLVASPVVFVIGALGVLLVLFEWTVSAWAERATGDPVANREIRNRLMYPIEIPVFGALGIIVAVVSISRVFLAVDRISSSVVAIVVAVLVLAGGFVVAYRPRLGKDAIAVMLTVFGLAVIAGGIIGAASGPREFEHHAEEHTDEPGSETDAAGGGDAGAEDERPPAGSAEDQDGSGDDAGTPDEPQEEQEPGIAEGGDQDLDVEEDDELAPDDDGSEG